MSNDSLAQSINKAIIDIIMNSPLNIPMLPDDIEREMYEKILETIEQQLENNKTCIEKCMLKVFSCCHKKDIVQKKNN
jgi:hypothetical protein